MKKLLGILVLGLLLTFSSNGISEEKSTEQTIIRSSYNEIEEMNVFKKKIKLPEDVAQGYVNAWKFALLLLSLLMIGNCGMEFKD